MTRRRGSAIPDAPRDGVTREELAGRFERGGSLGPCEWCLAGLHHICTGVNCYKCPEENHRRVGVAHVGNTE